MPTDSEAKANDRKGRGVRVQQTLWMYASLSKLPLPERPLIAEETVSNLARIGLRNDGRNLSP